MTTYVARNENVYVGKVQQQQRIGKRVAATTAMKMFYSCVVHDGKQ